MRPASGVEAVAKVRRGDAAGGEGEAAGGRREAEGARHRGRVLRARHGRVEQHAVVAQLHRARRVRGRSEAGVDDERHVGQQVADERERVRVGESHARADGRRERHHGRAAQVAQLARRHGVVAAVGEDLEAVGDELAGRAQQLDGVGVERLVVADDLELDEVRPERLAGELCRQDGLAGGHAAGRVGQQVERARAERASASSRLSPPPSRSIRRTATVTISVPDASTLSSSALQARVAARAEQHAARQRDPADRPRVGGVRAGGVDARVESGQIGQSRTLSHPGRP